MKMLSPTLRLTSWYVLLIMSVSVFFSVALYEIGMREVDTGLRRQATIFHDRITFLGPPQFDPTNDDFLLAQSNEVEHRLRVTLFLINTVIFFAGGGLSYLFAKRTLRPIEENLELQRRFTADASHELRTPLTAMRTELEVTLRSAQTAPEEYRKVIGSTLEEVQRLQDLSSRLLRLAQHDGPIQVDLATVSMAGVWQDAVRLVRAEAEKKHIQLIVPPQEAAVRAEHDGLVELLVIVLDNAIKYSPEHTTITLGLGAANGKAHLTIQDQGVGIAAPDLPHVFERFFRADASRTSQHAAGYGLGLPIAQQIVQRYKGTISLTSAVGRGTTVHITLPLAG